MKTWEVIIPLAKGGDLQTLSIQAATWMMALSQGLQQLSDPTSLSGLACNITPHGALEIVDTHGRRTFTIREIPASPESSAPAPGETPDPGAPRAAPSKTSPAAPAVQPPSAVHGTAPGVPRLADTASAGSAAEAVSGSATGSAAEAATVTDPAAATVTDPAAAAGDPANVTPAASPASAPSEQLGTAGGYSKRQTAEMVAVASDFFAKAAPGVEAIAPKATPAAAPPAAAPPTAAPPPAATPSAAPPTAATPPAATPSAAPPPAAPPPAATLAAAPPATAPPQEAQRDRLAASGEMALGESMTKPVPAVPPVANEQPAIILAEDLQKEIDQLEHVRKAREAAMSPPAMRPIPHKVFKVVAAAPDARRTETVRKRYVSVWPNPPEDALLEVLQIQLDQVMAELRSVEGPRRVLVAAFDHAFDTTSLRPPIGLCTWTSTTNGAQEPVFVTGETAASLWDPNQSSTGSSKSPLMVPALDPEAAERLAQAARGSGPSRTAIVSVPGRMVVSAAAAPGQVVEQPPTAATEQVPAQPPTAAPGQVPAQPPTAATGQVPAQPPTAAPGQMPAQPVPTDSTQAPGPAPQDPMAAAFERMHALFYMTDRSQALAYVLDSALGLLQSAAGAVLLYDPQQRDLYLVASRGPGGTVAPGYRVPLGDGLVGFCALQGLPLALTHVAQDARFRSVLSQTLGLAVHSIAGAPIQYEGGLHGVVEVVNQQVRGAYSPEELNTLAYIARQLGERLQSGQI